MTEPEWLQAADPWEMLAFLADKASERKLRLFVVACCRRITPLLEDERIRRAVEVAERHADDLASEIERQAAFRDACEARFGGRPIPARGEELDHAFQVNYWASSAAITATDPAPVPLEEVARQVAFEATMAVAYAATPVDGDTRAAAQEAERAIQAGLVRDIFGPLPFREVHIDSSVLRWNDGIVERMATTIYAERFLPDGTLDNGRIAVLADALEEGGIKDAGLLEHLRGPGPHVRGCFVVDAILGKL